MITVKATNIRCDQYPDGEQILHVSDAHIWRWGKVTITDVNDQNSLQYGTIEQFLREWTDIKYLSTVDQTQRVSTVGTFAGAV